MTKTPASPPGTFGWHNATQFTGALNDNLFKLLCYYALLVAWPDKSIDSTLVWVSVLFAVPFLLFLGAGGILADRFGKNRVVRGVKLAEIGVMGFGALSLYLGSGWMMLVTVFFMSTQSALFGPTKYGIIPELVGSSGISRANSYLQSATYAAIILGTALAPELSQWLGQDYGSAGIVCVVVAGIGYACSRRIAPTRPSGGNRKMANLFYRDLVSSLREVHRDGFLTLAVWGSAVFSMVAAYVQINFLTYGESILGLGAEESTRLFFLTAIGIGVGALLAGRLSRRGIEFGLVPIATALMATSCILLSITDADTSVFLAGSYGFVMGLGAGLFLVPIESFIQFRSPPERVGGIVAASAWLSWLGVLGGALLLYVNSKWFGLNPAEGFLSLALLLIALTGVGIWILPDFFGRFFVFVLTRVYYRVRVKGRENLPAQGPALLVANHASLMDAIWILSLQPRRVRFLVSRKYLEERGWFIRMLLKISGAIPIHEEDGPKAIVSALAKAKQALRDGYIVGIFPEGRLTRTGHLLPFKEGFERIVKGTDAPILPIGIHGGYRTYAGLGLIDEPRLFHPGDYGRDVYLSIGEAVSPEVVDSDHDAATLKERTREAVSEQILEAAHLRVEYSGSASERFVRCAKANRRKLAMADSEGKKLSFGRTLAGAVALRGILQDELSDDPAEIGIILPPSIGGTLTNLALVLDRRIPVNLNFTMPESSFLYTVRQSGVKTILTSRRVIEKLPDLKIPGRVVFLEELLERMTSARRIRAGLAALILPTSWLLAGKKAKGDDPLAILFSSGSTSDPKGIVLTHGNILSNVNAFEEVGRFRKTDRILGTLPFFHSLGLTVTIWMPMTQGVTVGFHSNPLEAGAIGEFSKKFHPTIILGTPSLLLGWARKIDPSAFSAVRWIIAGAEKLSPRIADFIEKRYGIRPYEGYGATECSPVVAVNVPATDLDGYRQEGAEDGTVGRALPNVRVRVVDPDTGVRRKDGDDGLIEVRGPSVFPGYLGDPEKSAEVLKDGWYRTGDIGHLNDDGFLTLTDRLSRFSKIAGEMVSHSMVENALREGLDVDADQLCVTSVPDEKRGERLVVLVTEKSGIDRDRFSEGLKGTDLPNLWKPSANSVVAVEEIPQLGTGKPDLVGIRKIAKERIG
tara:strand:+ start:5164 stop:8601 length:3438 start_codon:yes stop_codon:yes gene_type:complete